MRVPNNKGGCWYVLRQIAVFLGLVLGSATLYADSSVVLSEDVGIVALGPYLDILEDPDGEWGIEDVISPDLSSRFFRNTVDVPNFGFTKSAYWVRFRLQNSNAERGRFLLEVGYPMLDHISFFIISDNGRITTRESGYTLPFLIATSNIGTWSSSCLLKNRQRFT